jgi:hypothetical protein
MLVSYEALLQISLSLIYSDFVIASITEEVSYQLLLPGKNESVPTKNSKFVMHFLFFKYMHVYFLDNR